MEQQEIHDRLAADLALHGWAPATRATEGCDALPGWRVFLFGNLGYASVLWSLPEDRAVAEAGGDRAVDDAAMRLSHLTAILEVLVSSGYTAELEVGVNDTPQVRITRVPA